MKKLPILKNLLFLFLFPVSCSLFPVSPLFAAENPVTAQNGHFYLNGREFKFVGVNAKELISEGTTDAARSRNLEFLSQNCGVSIIRLFVQPGYYSLDGLKNVLEEGAKNGVRFILTLGDSWCANPPCSGYYRYDIEQYKQHARDLIIGLKNDYGNAIFAWELLNEPHCNYDNPYPGDDAHSQCVRGFYAFMKDFSAEIKTIDPNHLVFSGIIGCSDSDEETKWDSETWRELEPACNGSEYCTIHNISSIDACENHPYLHGKISKVEDLLYDLKRCQSSPLNKPFFVEEFNSDWPDDRQESIQKAIDLVFINNGDGLLVWPLAGDDIYVENNPICNTLKEKADQYNVGQKSPYSLALGEQTIPSQPSLLTACPIEIYPCGTAGPEDNPFYPYPGSSCYRLTKSPKVISNYNLSAQKTFQITVPATASCPDYSPNWNFIVGAEGDNLKIPVVRQVSELFEGESPYNRKKSLDENGPILEDYSPLVKLIPYSPKLDILKQIIAVSAIDSQYSRFAPAGTVLPQGELADNPIHDYIIAYAIPANGRPADCSTDKNWWYAGEEMKDVAGARPIRASEPDCTSLLVNGSLPDHAEAKIAGFRSQSLYAGVVCPKLYGQPFGAANGIYAQELQKQGKMLCPLSDQVRVEVWKEFMPVVSHETEPAEITLTFDDQPVGEGKIYLPHLARLAQLSEIFKETLNPKMEEPSLEDIFTEENITVSSPNQELICPISAPLAIPAAQGGQSAKVEVSESITGYTKTCTYKLTQPGTLKTAIPELINIKENLVGDNGFFRAWLPKEIAQKIDEEVMGNDALEGEGKIKIAGNSGTTISPNEISLKYPFLRSVERYYEEFLKLITPEID